MIKQLNKKPLQNSEGITYGALLGQYASDLSKLQKNNFDFNVLCNTIGFIKDTIPKISAIYGIPSKEVDENIAFLMDKFDQHFEIDPFKP